MSENFELKDGRKVSIKRLYRRDFEENDNYAYFHNWLIKIDDYTGRDFKREELE